MNYKKKKILCKNKLSEYIKKRFFFIHKFNYRRPPFTKCADRKSNPPPLTAQTDQARWLNFGGNTSGGKLLRVIEAIFDFRPQCQDMEDFPS